MGQAGVFPAMQDAFLMEKKKLECPVVSQICTLWPSWFHQEFFIFSLMQPVCPDIPSFAHFDDCCFTSKFFLKSDATHMSDGDPPTAVGYPPHFLN